MRSFMLSRRGLDNSRSSLAVAGANRWRVRGRVQMAIVVSLVCLAGLGFVMSPSLLAEDPDPAVPTIEGFQVTWEETDPENNIFTFTFSGSIRNAENLVNPHIRLTGYPFSEDIVTYPNGDFRHEISMNGDVAFGITIIAVVLENGDEVSEVVHTST